MSNRTVQFSRDKRNPPETEQSGRAVQSARQFRCCYCKGRDLFLPTAISKMLQYHKKVSTCGYFGSPTWSILDKDPHHRGAAAIIHLSTLVELKLKNELFYFAHQLVDAAPTSAVSWYGVGCYYYLIGNYENARKYFRWHQPCNSVTFTVRQLLWTLILALLGWVLDIHLPQKASTIKPWLLIEQPVGCCPGTSFTFPLLISSCHLAPLCIGMELIRVNNFSLAMTYLSQAKDMCSNDPLIYNELGVVCYRNKE